MTNHLLDTLGLSRPDRAGRLFAAGDGGRWTYGDLDARARAFAGAIQAAGVAPGDRVAAQIAKSLDGLALYLGTVRAGAVFLPLNTAYTGEEIAYFLSDAEARLAVVDPERQEALAPVAAEAGARLATLAGLLSGADPIAGDVPRGPQDLAAILYTSGTTGRSKGAMLTHENLASNARVLTEAWAFTERDILLHALPIFHTHGLFVATNVTLVAGGALRFHARFDAANVLADLANATAMMGVPTFYTRLLAEPGLTREAVGHIRLFVSGSAPLLAETHAAWEDRTGHAILERYGMTETSMNTSNPYDGPRRAGTVGLALPGVEVVVTDPETGRPLPTGEIGMIEVRGPNVFQGYWRMPDKTAEELRDTGFFITGDLGRLDDEGYLSIVGRAKDLIISGGYNVYPKEVETALDTIPGVAESAVIGLPHPDFGEGVVAVVVPHDPALTEAAVLAGLEGRVAKFKQPKRIVFVAQLPRNTMGKVQKKVLRETYSASFSSVNAR